MSSPKWVLVISLVLVTTTVALLVRMAFDWFVGPAPAFLIPFFLPVVAVALYAGTRWGLLTTILNTALVGYFFTPPVYSFAILAFEDQLRVGSFVGLGVAISGITGKLRHYRQLAEQNAMALASRKDELEVEVAWRREAERKLELRVNERTAEIDAQKRLLDAVLDCLPVAVIIADPTGKYVRFNRASYEICGAEPQAAGIVDYPAWVGYWPNNGRRVEPTEWPLNRAVLRNESCTEEILIERFGDQSRRTVRISAAPVRGLDGTVIAGVVTGVDVTEQNQLVDSLRESERRFRAVFHTQFQFIGLMSTDGVLVEANQTALAAAGVLEETVVGKPFWETVWWTHDTVQQQRLREAILCAAAGRPDRFEASHPRADGSIMWVDFSLTPYRQDGKVVLLIPEGRDITERKLDEAAFRTSEERFRAAMEGSLDSVFFLTADRDATGAIKDFRFAEVNQRGCELLNSTREQVLGHRLCELLPVNRDGGFFDKYVRVLETEQPLEEEFMLGASDGLNANWLRHQVIRGGDGVTITTQDITARKQVEAELLLSEARFKMLAGDAPVGIFETDAHGNCLFVNSRWCTLAGMTQDAAMGKGWVDALHSDDRDRVFREWSSATENRCEFLSEYRFQTASGNVTWLSGNAVALRDAIGVVVGFIGTVTDITARKLAEAELRLSEERFRRLVDGVSNHAIFMLDTNGHIISWNPAAQKIKGYTAEEILGKHFSIFYTPRDVFAMHPQNELAIAMAEGRYQEEGERVRKDGSLFWADITISALHDEAGKLVGFVKFAFDITQRKRSTELITALVESSSDAHLIFNREGIIECNQAAVNMMRMSSKKELLLKHPAEFSPKFQPDGRNSIEKSIEMDALARKNGFHRFDWIHTRADGEEFPCEVTLTPIQLESGDALLVVWHEISERVRFQAQLQTANGQLSLINEELTQFAYIASHDLKAPLRGINSLADFVIADCKDILPEESIKHLQMIKKRIFRMQQLLEDLLEYSQVGHDTGSTRKVNLNCVIQSAIELCEIPANIKLEFIGDDTEFETWVTPLETCIRNLIGNSIKHRDHPGGRVRIETKQSVNFITFSVCDDGRGIPVEHHERIFRMFEALKRRDEVEGSGMGLAVVKKTVEAIGGSVTVESPNFWGGCTFHLHWPNGPRVST